MKNIYIFDEHGSSTQNGINTTPNLTLTGNSMENSKILIICQIVMLLFVSCSKSLTDLGYSSSYPQPAYNPNSVVTNAEFRNFSPITGTNISPFYKSSERSYDLYTCVTDNDIEDFYRSSVSTRMDILSKFCSQTDAQTKYEISYEGEDWFCVSPVGNENKARVHMVLAGKKLQPQIAEVDNPSSAVNAIDENILRVFIKSLPKAKTSDRYANFLSDILYRGCHGATKGYVEEKDIVAFANNLVQQRTLLLSEFYSDLTSDSFKKKDFSKKYSNMLTKSVAKAIEARKTNEQKGEWAFFAPSIIDGYKIAYDTEDWFKIYNRDINHPDIRVQIVYNGKSLKPLITGLCNDARQIDVHQSFTTYKRSRPTGW